MTRRSLPLLALLAAVAVCGAAHGATLGRLFTSPADRAQLDALRAASANVQTAAPAADAEAVPQAPAPPPEPTVLNGFVKRSGGKTTVWLNQTPQDDAANLRAAKGALSLRLPSGRQVILQPGQRYDPVDDKVKDAHEP